MAFAPGAPNLAKIGRTANERVPMAKKLEHLQFWMQRAQAGDVVQVVPRPEHRRRMAIVGGGHSAERYVESLIRDWDGDVWAMNGAYGWLRKRYIIPDAVMLLNPERDMVNYIQDVDPEVTFYVASTSDPAVWDCLRGRAKLVRLFHASEGDGANGKVENVTGLGVLNHPVQGGPSVTTRAPFLGHILGFRDFHFFGADSSFPNDTTTHVYGHDDSQRMQTVMVRCNGKAFFTQMALVIQAQFLNFLVRSFPHCEWTVHGADTLAAAMIEANGEYEAVGSAVPLAGGGYGPIAPFGATVDSRDGRVIEYPWDKAVPGRAARAVAGPETVQ